MHCGASPFKTSKTNDKILKSILKLTGSKDARIEAICSCFLVPVKSHAAEFWTNCQRESALCEMMVLSALQ